MNTKLLILALAALVGSASAAHIRHRGRSLQQATPLKSIAVLATGGIFVRDANGNRVPLAADGLLGNVPGLGNVTNIAYFRQIALIDSSEATPDFWITVATNVQAALANTSVDGVIVLHGPDTMPQTAWFMQCVTGIGNSPKSIVLTGSIRGFGDLSPDGPVNVLSSAITATQLSGLGAGVVMVINDQIFSSKYAQRDFVNTADLIGTASGGGRVGFVAGGKVVPLAIPDGKKICPGYPLPAALPPVALLNAYPGSDAGVIGFYANSSYKGIVFSALGTGNIGGAYANATLPLIAGGLRAVVARGAVQGITDPTAGCPGCLGTTIRSGMVSALVLDPFQARITLMLALATTPTITTAALQAQYNNITYNF